MTSGTLIRQARTRAGLSQVELGQRSGKDRAQIARWERDVVQPSLETLREVLRACGFDVELALEEISARRPDGRPLVFERDVVRQPVLELETDAGELKVVPEPAGTRGYDDLRHRATREPLGHGLRPSVASVDDHARMLAA